MRKALLISAVLLLLCGATAANADLLVDRGLPTANLNNAAGSDRSNVCWASTDPGGFTGDDFTIGTVGQTYRVDSITVWGVQYDPARPRHE